MCTVTWVHEDGGYHLLCNRDEKKTRAVALGPRITARDGVRFIAPTDGDFGGTWIGSNEFGISVCLLNDAGLTDGPRRLPEVPYASRGLILPPLMAAESVVEVCDGVWKSDLATFAPFTLAVLEPNREAAVVEWTGADKNVLLSADRYLPLVSSSFDADRVRASRRAEFRRLQPTGRLDADALHRFHDGHGPRRDAYSPCMHRPDAETVSFSWVKVTTEEVDFFYSPAAPCKWAPGQIRKLARRA